MKRNWMGAIMAGAMLSSGCSTVIGGALAGPGASAGASHAMTFQKGPVYAVSGEDYHSLIDPIARRPSSTSPVGMATPRAPTLGPEDSPLAEWESLSFGVKGLSSTDIRRLGLSGYMKTWAEQGLGRSVADISHDPSTSYIYVQFRAFPGSGGSRLVLH